MDLAGDSYEQEFGNVPTLVEGQVKWIHTKYKSRRNVIKLNLVGSKVLKMSIKGGKYQCSHAHFTMPLRKIPKAMGLSIEVKKGEFPYKRLKRSNWGKTLPFPSLAEFDIDAQTESRRKEIERWHTLQTETTWDFDQQLWSYLFADVDVGCAGLEAYHKKSEELHCDIWRAHSDQLDNHVSPLNYSTAPGWALAMYRTWFLPDNISILKPSEGKFIRDSLRGGRTDKRCNWLAIDEEALKDGDKIMYYDFKSLYPSVQKCSVHDTHFPVGPPSWLTFKGPTTNEDLIQKMGDKTGFIKISCHPTKYVTHPTLHRVGSYSPEEKDKKLLFELDSKIEQVYAWPEILEAIESEEIVVDYIHEGLLFEKGTDTFTEYVDFFFKVKDQAEIDKNDGLRSLSKLLLNSLWGKLGQRSYQVNEWVTYAERLDYLLGKFDSGEYELTSCQMKDEYRAHFTYSIKEDMNNLFNTGYQIAAFVSMWGRVILHKKLLREHGMRALYCDTDSAIIYLRGGIDTVRFTGNGLGDLTNELSKIIENKVPEEQYGQCYIKEVVLVAPKTYALKVSIPNGPDITKVVCKGFELSFANSQTIHFQSMKELVFTNYHLNAFMNGKTPSEDLYNEPKRLRVSGAPRLNFISSLARNDIAPTEVYRSKGLTGQYTKGRRHPYDWRFIAPFSKMKIEPPRDNFLSLERSECSKLVRTDKHFL